MGNVSLILGKITFYIGLEKDRSVNRKITSWLRILKYCDSVKMTTMINACGLSSVKQSRMQNDIHAHAHAHTRIWMM